MMIPKEKIDEVRERASIVSVVSEYLPLKKRGQNHTGLCPFHSEKTPSFTVSEEKKIYYCFGCNATGNVITFVMKKEGLSFPEAVKSLAAKFGVSIAEEKRIIDAREQVYLALKAAEEYFVRSLQSAEGKPARDYLKKRGFEGEILKRFGVGFSPNRWEGLAGYLRHKNIPVESAEKAGLLIKKEKGHYDRFRARVMFPITDAKGRVIGFGGRTIDNTEPKYLNSPESVVFKKGETLYGLFQARQAVAGQDSAVVVEGYFDLLAMHSKGFANTVATMGTAITPEHVRAIKGHAGAVYALFDSDEAGRNAAIRSLAMFLAEDMPCRAVLLKDGKDPDEFLASKGAEAMKEAIEKADTLMEFYFKELQKRINIKTPEGKAKYLDSALQYLSRVRSVAEKGHYAAVLASTLGIAVGSVYEALKDPGPIAVAVRHVKDVIDARSSNLKELTILKVILRHPELYDERVEEAINSFRDPVLKEAGKVFSSFCRKGQRFEAPAVLDEIPDEMVKACIAGLLFREEDGFIEEPHRMLEDSLKRVLNRGRLKDATQEMIKKLEDEGRADVAGEMKKRMEAGASGKKP